MKYCFDYDKLTVRDISELLSGDISRTLVVLDKAVAGGILARPSSEFPVVVREHGEQFRAWIEGLNDQENANLRDLLRGVKGIDDAN